MRLLFFVLLNSYVCALQMLHAQQLIPLDESAYLKQINKSSDVNKDAYQFLYNKLLLSEFYAQTDSLKSRSALDTVVSSPQKEILGEGVLSYYQAIFYLHQGNKKQAKGYFESAIKELENQPKKSDLLIKAWYHLGYLQVEEKGYDFMVETLTKYCIPLSVKHHNSELLAFSYTQLGLTFMSVGDFNKAELYHQNAIQELNKLKGLSNMHLITYLNMVSNYCYKPDSKTAKIYLDRAKKLIAPFPNSNYYPSFYYQEAMYYTTIEDYNRALISLYKGIHLAEKQGQKKLLQLLYFRIYNIYLMQKNYVKAKAQLEQILAEKVLQREAVNRRITYTQLASVNEMLGDYAEAYQWIKKAAALGDSLQEIKLLEKMNELEILHQSAEKQQKIYRLQKENQRNNLLSKNKNIRIFALAGTLVLCLIITLLLFINFKKQQILNRQISINHEKDLQKIQNQQKYEATRAILQGEEQERRRIAQDIHDSLGGMLSNLRLMVSVQDSYDKNNILEKLDKSITEMRRISRNLMPETLKNLGLEIALRELCESVSQMQLAIQFEAYNIAENIPFNTQVILYRITEESLSNVLKHAQASNVIVQISQNLCTLNLTIEDDGTGFDQSKIKPGLGLNNIQNRVQIISGIFSIRSNIGEGTTINIDCHV